ncbi:MAG: DegT/DnrJ/EryC1/StrS family aminotransferase [Microthrixaceae bacterium]
MGEKRVLYAGSVHDEAEIEAVVEVLRSGPTAFRIGRRVSEFERRVAELFGKASGIAVNSGSSALYMAVELLDLPPGAEVLTSVLTFSTDVAPLVRAGLVPVFVDVEPNTYNVDIDAMERLIGADTAAILVPNLVGNAPDWDRIRQLADAHGLLVIEDSCDALGATLRGTPTGTRSDLSVTSFAASHIITAAGNGGMVLLDDEAMRDRGLLLRRWGRSSEVQFYGSRKGDDRFMAQVDGMEYDSLFVFEELGWNFEPSELGAAFGLEQLNKLANNYRVRQRNFAAYQESFGLYPELFDRPVQLPGLDTAWLAYPFVVRPEGPLTRSELQRRLEDRGIDTRMVWTGNVTRQPMMRGVTYRADPDGYPNADRVMEHTLLLPCNHFLTDDDVSFVCDAVARAVEDHG